MKLDFTPTRKKITIDFRHRIFMRNGTHTYLWLRDGRSYGYFLTMDTGSIEVAKLEMNHGTYRVYKSGQEYWDLEPFEKPYSFEKAVRMYWESTLDRSERAEREMCDILGTEPGLRAIRDMGTPQPKREKPASAPKQPSVAGFSLAELCAEINVSPSDARKLLRGRVEKPGSKWEWPNKEAAAGVRAILMEAQV